MKAARMFIMACLLLTVLSGCVTRKQLQQRDTRITELDQEVALLKSDLVAKDQLLAELRSERDDLQRNIAEKTAASEKEISLLQENLNQLESSYMQAQKEKESLQRSLDQTTDINSQEARRLRTEMADKDRELTRLMTDREDLQKKITAQSEMSAREIGSMKEDLAKKERELAQLRTDKTDLERAIAEKTIAAESEIRELKASVTGLEKELADVTLERDLLMGKVQADVIRMQAIGDTLKLSLKDYIDKGVIEILQYDGLLVINIVDTVMFDPDSAVLKKEYEPVIRILAEAFNKVPEKIIRVEGHTAVSSNSRYKNSWILGSERSISVINFLQDKCGVDPKRLVVISHGEYRPIAPNDNRDNMRRNRRVTFVLMDRPLYQMEDLKRLNETKSK